MIPATLLSFVRIKFEYTGRSRTKGAKRNTLIPSDLPLSKETSSEFKNEQVHRLRLAP